MLKLYTMSNFSLNRIFSQLYSHIVSIRPLYLAILIVTVTYYFGLLIYLRSLDTHIYHVSGLTRAEYLIPKWLAESAVMSAIVATVLKTYAKSQSKLLRYACMCFLTIALGQVLISLVSLLLDAYVLGQNLDYDRGWGQ